MGKRGPKPKPFALRVVDGRELEQPPEPPSPDDRPTPPAWLTPLALAEWRRIELELWEQGCLSRIDQALFAAYCQAYGRYEQAEIDLNAWISADLDAQKKSRAKKKPHATHGAVVKTKTGNQIMNPLFGIVNTLRRDMQRLAAEFGLSPSARVSVTGGRGGGGGDKDSIEKKYFGG
jgi:phage terminase small subunit